MWCDAHLEDLLLGLVERRELGGAEQLDVQVCERVEVERGAEERGGRVGVSEQRIGGAQVLVGVNALGRQHLLQVVG
jgi:hypothetical protein